MIVDRLRLAPPPIALGPRRARGEIEGGGARRGERARGAQALEAADEAVALLRGGDPGLERGGAGALGLGQRAQVHAIGELAGAAEVIAREGLLRLVEGGDRAAPLLLRGRGAGPLPDGSGEGDVVEQPLVGRDEGGGAGRIAVGDRGRALEGDHGLHRGADPPVRHAVHPREQGQGTEGADLGAEGLVELRVGGEPARAVALGEQGRGLLDLLPPLPAVQGGLELRHAGERGLPLRRREGAAERPVAELDRDRRLPARRRLLAGREEAPALARALLLLHLPDRPPRRLALRPAREDRVALRERVRVPAGGDERGERGLARCALGGADRGDAVGEPAERGVRRVPALGLADEPARALRVAGVERPLREQREDLGGAGIAGAGEVTQGPLVVPAAGGGDGEQQRDAGVREGGGRQAALDGERVGVGGERVDREGEERERGPGRPAARRDRAGEAALGAIVVVGGLGLLAGREELSDAATIVVPGVGGGLGRRRASPRARSPPRGAPPRARGLRDRSRAGPRTGRRRRASRRRRGTRRGGGSGGGWRRRPGPSGRAGPRGRRRTAG